MDKLSTHLTSPLWRLRMHVAIASMALATTLFAADPPPEAASSSVTTTDLLAHIQTLSSDDFEGRGPASLGEQRTVAYLEEQFKRMDLKPGNPDGSFIQKVPMMGIKSEVSLSLGIGNTQTNLQFPQDFVGWSARFQKQVDVAGSELVFVGYGVVAPEHAWDDFKGVDVRGKTLVMLVNDPPLPDPNDPSKLDEKMFRGKAMTYYGRWTYKYEIAAEKGAAAAIVVHETGPAGYPYFVVINSWSSENFDLRNRDREPLAVASWMSLERAKATFAAVGKDFDELKKAALSRDFRPIPLGAKATFQVKNTLREVESKNVIARLDGSDPKLRNEYVIYTAHWDHLGRNQKLQADQIFNGAVDNATGVAALMEIAQAYGKLKPAPRRTTLFLAVTAEEQGLLGAKYYATHPLYPLDRTLANINMDSMNPYGRTKDVNVVGFGQNTLEDVLRAAATGQGRTIVPESQPEKGFYYRSDHFEFAKVGVPALYLKTGVEFVGKPPGWGAEKLEHFIATDYHKVSDDIKPDWDLSGLVEDARLLFDVGYRVSQSDQWPEWKTGSEFAAKRRK